MNGLFRTNLQICLVSEIISIEEHTIKLQDLTLSKVMSDLKEDRGEDLTDNSQSSLQTVLVTFRLDKPSDKQIKRVRFNSLVQVKCIPRRRKKIKTRNKIDVKEGKACVENAMEKSAALVDKAENEEKEGVFNGAASVSEKWVATTIETSSEVSTEESWPSGPTYGLKYKEKEPANELRASVMEGDSLVKSVGKETTDNKSKETATTHAEVVKSRGAPIRKSYTTNKITLGSDYIGNALRLKPTTWPISAPIQFSEFPPRNSRKQNVHDTGTKAVWLSVEKQAQRFCREAEALINQVTEKNARIQSKLKEQSDPVLLGGNKKRTLLYEHTSYRKPSSMPDVAALTKSQSHSDAPYGNHGETKRLTGGKPITRFPYIRSKKKQMIMDTSQMSSSELCLPHLLLHDGNCACSPAAIAKSDGKKEVAKLRDSEFETIKQEASRNGNVFISFSYGQRGLGLRPSSTVD